MTPAELWANKLELDSENGGIKHGDELISNWREEAYEDYPEDLIWERDIGELVRDVAKAAFNAGQKCKC